MTDQDLRRRVDRLQEELRQAQRELQVATALQRPGGTLSPQRAGQRQQLHAGTPSPARLAPMQQRNRLSPPPVSGAVVVSSDSDTTPPPAALSAAQLHMLKQTKRAVAIIESLMQPRARRQWHLPTLPPPPPPAAPEEGPVTPPADDDDEDYLPQVLLLPRDANDAVTRRRKKRRENPAEVRREVLPADGTRPPLVMHLRGEATGVVAPSELSAEELVTQIMRRRNEDAALQRRQQELDLIAQVQRKSQSIGFEDARIVVTAIQAQMRGHLSARIAQSLMPCLQPLVNAHLANVSMQLRSALPPSMPSTNHASLLRGCIMLRAVQRYGLRVEVLLIAIQRHIAAAISMRHVNATRLRQDERVARLIRDLEHDL